MIKKLIIKTSLHSANIYPGFVFDLDVSPTYAVPYDTASAAAELYSTLEGIFHRPWNQHTGF